jgi:hypothetical protein
VNRLASTVGITTVMVAERHAARLRSAGLLFAPDEDAPSRATRTSSSRHREIGHVNRSTYGRSREMPRGRSAPPRSVARGSARYRVALATRQIRPGETGGALARVRSMIDGDEQPLAIPAITVQAMKRFESRAKRVSPHPAAGRRQRARSAREPLELDAVRREVVERAGTSRDVFVGQPLRPDRGEAPAPEARSSSNRSRSTSIAAFDCGGQKGSCDF